jgi:lipoic acid synthetase
LYVASGPLVRSSYRAAEAFVRSLLGSTDRAQQGQGLVQAVLDDRLAVARREALRLAAQSQPAEVADAWHSSLDGGASAEKLLDPSSLVRRPPS